MKYVSSQLSLFLKERGVRRNLGSFSRFVFLMLVMISVYSALFHYIMLLEGREYSLVTGVYWTLTVMSTLGFGDITFQSDLGKLFSVVVLLSGILSLLVTLPFAFIQLIYTPWMEAQKKSQTPREVVESVKGHIILVGLSPITLNIVDDLTRYGFYCVLLSPDTQTTLDLLDQGYHAVLGGHDDGSVYKRLGINRAAMLVALDNDIRNTNVVFSAREVSRDIPIIARAEKIEAIDILTLAGCSQVFQFRNLLGHALAGRVLNDSTRASVLTRFGNLVITEAPVTRTSLVGKTILESNLRRRLGLNVVGIWEQGVFRLPLPSTLLSEKTVLVLAGTEEQMARFDLEMGAGLEKNALIGPVLILGGGRVGEAAARDLRSRNIPVSVVDKIHPGGEQNGITWFKGDAADLTILETAGINSAPSVIITTHDDDTNIYLTIYCRRLRPDIQIISRASLDRNFGILHSAGADLVLSLATMITTSLINILSPGKVFLLNEGLNIFRAIVDKSLAGQNLISSGIRAKTHCSVVALCTHNQEMLVNPAPDYEFQQNDLLYLVGDSRSEASFYEHYGYDTGQNCKVSPKTFQPGNSSLPARCNGRNTPKG